MVRCIFMLFAFFVCGHNFCEWHKSAGLADHSGNSIGLCILRLHVADLTDLCYVYNVIVSVVHIEKRILSIFPSSYNMSIVLFFKSIES